MDDCALVFSGEQGVSQVFYSLLENVASQRRLLRECRHSVSVDKLARKACNRPLKLKAVE